VLWAGGRPFDLDLTDAAGSALNDVLPEGCAEIVPAEAKLALAQLSHRRIEIDTTAAGGGRQYEIWFDADTYGTNTTAVAISRST
jgi:hypothetical protein